MASPISFKCSECKGDISVDSTLSGFNVACPYCGKQQAVPVVVNSSAGNPIRSKIKVKRDEPQHIAAPPSDADNEEQQEVEYIVVEEQAAKGNRFLVVGVAVLVLLAGALVFFGVRSYLVHSWEVQAAQQKAQEEAARKAALEEKESRLKPTWDDAMVMVDRAKRLKTDVDSSITLLERLRQGDFAATKYESMATEEIQRLNILKLSVAEDQRRAKLDAEKAEESRRLQAQQQSQQQALQDQLRAQQEAKGKPASATPSAPAFNRAAAMKSLAKQIVSGDWKAAERSVKSWSDKAASAKLAPIFEAAASQSRIIADSFKGDIGNEISISLIDGSTVPLKILSVRGDAVQATRKIEKASIAFEFNDASLSVDERVSRLAKSSPEAAALLRIFARCALDQTSGDALTALSSIPSDNQLLVALRDAILPELKEIFAAKGFAVLMARLRLDAAMNESQIQAAISRVKISSQAAKIEMKAPVDSYSTEFKSTAYFRSVASKLGAISRAIDALKVAVAAPAPAPAATAPAAPAASGSKSGALGGVGSLGGGSSSGGSSKGGGIGGVGSLGGDKK